VLNWSQNCFTVSCGGCFLILRGVRLPEREDGGTKDRSLLSSWSMVYYLLYGIKMEMAEIVGQLRCVNRRHQQQVARDAVAQGIRIHRCGQASFGYLPDYIASSLENAPHG